MSFPSEDGIMLQAWWMKGAQKKGVTGKPVLLFFHGNGGNLAAQYSQFGYLNKWGYDFLALDYRGFGLSEGIPSRDGIRRDAIAALEYLHRRCPERKIVVIGHSMGTVFAMQLAARRTFVDKLVLIAPFTSFKEIGETALRGWGTNPFLAHWIAWWCVTEKMDTIRVVVTEGLPPVLIVHGTSDGVVPYDMGRKVFEAYRGTKTWLTMDGYGHENYHEGPMGSLYHKTLEGFFSLQPTSEAPPK